MNYRIPLSQTITNLSEVGGAFHQQLAKPFTNQISEFEDKLVELTGASHAVAVNSGTSALHLALKALDVKPGDEVVCPTFTFAATAFPILYEKAIPVFVDSENHTWNMDPDILEQLLVEKSKGNSVPKAIIVAHIYGMPAQMDRIIEIGNAYGIPVIEDAAEAFGSRYKGRMVGLKGEIGVYSFNNNKVITSLGGGALVSKNKSLIDKSRYWASQSKEDKPFYYHLEVGYNYRISPLNASLGYAQLKVLDANIQKRLASFDFYREHLTEDMGFKFCLTPEFYFSNRWLSTVLVNSADSGCTPMKIASHLEDLGIEARPLWKPMHQQPVFSRYETYLNGVANQLFEKGLCLPSGPDLTMEDLSMIVQAVESCCCS